MMSRCSGESFDQHFRRISLRCFFWIAISGSSAVSSMARAVSSSRLSSPLRRSNDRALKRAIARSPVETAARALKLCRLAPDVEEHLADQVLGQRLVAHEAQDEPIHTHMMAREQNTHCEPIARRDSCDQRFV